MRGGATARNAMEKSRRVAVIERKEIIGDDPLNTSREGQKYLLRPRGSNSN